MKASVDQLVAKQVLILSEVPLATAREHREGIARDAIAIVGRSTQLCEGNKIYKSSVELETHFEYTVRATNVANQKLVPNDER